MNALESYTINQRQFSLLNPLKDELNVDPSKNYLFDLSHLSLIEVKGDKAFEFLQGQLTCDMNQVNAQQMQKGLMCNLKGRILAMLDVLSCQNECFLLLPDDMIEKTISSLAKTAMISRVQLKKNTSLKIYGFLYQNPEDIRPIATDLPDKQYQLLQSDEGCIYHLGHGFYMLIIEEKHQQKLLNSFKEQGQLRGSLAWHHLSLADGQLNIYPETRGEFLPHRLDLHQTGYISFNKGCYKGQEIIARTHYKAKLKHELKLYQINCQEAIYPGQKLLDEDNKTEIAELIDYSPIDSNQYLIAVSILKTHPERLLFDGHHQAVLLTRP